VAGAPFVSVLTPVYNGAEYLHECIDSVVAQTYPAWELVVVDNRSEDGTPEIASAFAAKDSRIRLVRCEEFVARELNHDRAFRAADPASAYVKVVQADDWLFPECLERMVGLAEQHPSIGVVSAYRLKETSVDLDGLPYDRSFVPGREIVRRAMLGQTTGIGSPTSLLLRADLVRTRSPFYGLDMYNADLDAILDLLMRSDYGFVHQVLTFSRRQVASALETAVRLSAFDTELIRLTLRYGPTVLTDEELRARVRAQLRQYAGWHLKQCVRPSRWRDPEFRSYHREQLDRIVDAGDGDPYVSATARLVFSLLGGRGD
jgi:glycosyltransferase involved in cell wall biosynthesis